MTTRESIVVAVVLFLMFMTFFVIGAFTSVIYRSNERYRWCSHLYEKHTEVLNCEKSPDWRKGRK